MNNEIHLSWWEMKLRDPQWMNKFKGWCGSHESPFKKIIRKHIAEKGYKSVLDCAAGLCSEYYGFREDRYEIDYWAVDITPVLVEEGQKNGIEISCQNIDTLLFKDKRFDVCICLDTLNHQKDFELSIVEMIRVTKFEVIVSFFKNFSKSEKDIIEVKDVNSESNPILIYNHFSKGRLSSFLDKLGMKFTYSKTEDNRDLLYIDCNEENNET